MESHNCVQDIFRQLQILLAVGPKIELFGEAFDVQILKAGFEQPFVEKVVCHNLDSVLETYLMGSKLVSRHLIEALAELANGVRNH